MMEEAISKRYQEEGPPSPKDTGRHTTTRARTMMEEAISKRYQEEGPPSFYCPIGLELMCDPVILVEVRVCGRSLARRPRPRLWPAALSCLTSRAPGACTALRRLGTRSRELISRPTWP
jgi:hypothetical protein